jgi:C-terminal peptidase prc
MSRRCLLLFLSLLVAGSAWSAADEPGAAKPPDVSFCRLLWAATDLVLDRHVDPPTRQQLLLAGVKELLTKTGKTPGPELSRRISTVTTPEQFAALVADVCPGKHSPEIESAAVEAALVTVPGRAHLYGPAEASATKIVENNNYVGIGIQIRMNSKEKLAEIAVPFAGGPFRRAGGKTNDLIVEVDGASQADHKLVDVVKALRGEEGSAVTALVRQPGATETRLLKMVREVIPFQSAVGYRRVSEETFDFRPDAALPVAYLRLEQLSSSTYHELRRLERQLRSEGNRALVLDLRGTQPGALVHAAQVADAFLDGGLMWKVRDAHGRVTEFKADRDCLFRDWPVAVLVDEMTLETAALIAEGLQDRGRAVLVGSPSAAGQTVKSLELLPDGMGGVNLVTGTVERLKPAARPGIVPDHAVELNAKRRDAILAWHGSQVSPEPPTAKAPDDSQLAKALALLGEALKEKKPDHQAGAAGR